MKECRYIVVGLFLFIGRGTKLLHCNTDLNRGGTEQRIVYKGDKLHLVCDVYGTPKPQVTW